MARRKTSLRDFQSYLAGRLNEAAAGLGGVSWLSVESGTRRWLMDLSDSGEIVQVPPLLPVPLTLPWFAGLANIRGSLYAVSDFSVFCGGAPTPRSGQARILLIGTRHNSNAALLVNRLLGLKNPEDFSALQPGTGTPSWDEGTMNDDGQNDWHKLSVRHLLDDKNFMNIGV